MHPAGPKSLYSTLASIVGNSQVPHSPIPLDPIDVKLIGLFSVDTALKASTEQLRKRMVITAFGNNETDVCARPKTM